MAQCATTALASAVPRPCVRGARGRFGGFGSVPGVVSLPFPPSRPACPALRVAGRPVRVSLTLARWYAIPRGPCVPRARSGCPSGSPRVPFACVCARAPAASAPPSPWVVWRAHLARSRHWALVGPFHVVRAPPRVLPRSLALSGVLWGGAVRSRFPPTWLGVVGMAEGRPRGGCLPLLRGASGVRRSPSPDCPPTRRAVGVRYPHALRAGVWAWGPYTVPLACTPCGGCVLRGWWGAVPLPGLGLCAPRGAGPWRSCAGGRAGGGGRPVRRAPHLWGRGGPVGRGAALPRPVPLPPLGRQQSGCHWRRSVHGGRGPPYHSGSCSPAFTGRDLCGVLARWRGLACSLRFLWEPAARAGGAGRAPAPLSGGGSGDHPPCLGGWSRGPRGLRAGGGDGGGGALGGGPRFPTLDPLLSSAHSPPACACGRGRGAAPGWGGMRGGPWTPPLGAPADLNPPSALPGGLWSWEGHGGRGLHTVLVRRRAPPPGLVCTLLWRTGVGSPVGRDPRGSRRPGALGRAVCRSSRIPPPPASRSLLGEQGRFLASWGAEGRSRGPQARGGGAGGGGGGAAPPPPPPCWASACHLLSPVCPSEVNSCRGGCRAAAGVRRSPVGRQWVSAGGGGGGEPPALVRAPFLTGPASEGAAPFAPSWAPPACRRPAACRACGRLPRPWCPLTPGAAASSGGGAGPPFLRSASVRSWA